MNPGWTSSAKCPSSVTQMICCVRCADACDLCGIGTCRVHLRSSNQRKQHAIGTFDSSIFVFATATNQVIALPTTFFHSFMHPYLALVLLFAGATNGTIDASDNRDASAPFCLLLLDDRKNSFPSEHFSDAIGLSRGIRTADVVDVRCCCRSVDNVGRAFV